MQKSCGVPKGIARETVNSYNSQLLKCWKRVGDGRGSMNVRVVNMLFRSHVTGKMFNPLSQKVNMKIVCDINCSTC